MGLSAACLSSDWVRVQIDSGWPVNNWSFLTCGPRSLGARESQSTRALKLFVVWRGILEYEIDGAK